MTKFENSDYSAMIEMWGICTLCERSVHDNSDTLRKYVVHHSCGCLVHADEKCPFPKVRESHEKTSHATKYIQWAGVSQTFEYRIVSGFVKKTFPFETVKSAFTKNLSNESPYLKNIILKADRESEYPQEIAALKLELEQVRADSESKVVLAEQKAEEATNKLAVITEQIEKMKKDWKELQNQDVQGDSKNTKMTSFEYSPAIGSDEHVLDVEWDKFKQKFSQIHGTVATMLQNSFTLATLL